MYALFQFGFQMLGCYAHACTTTVIVPGPPPVLWKAVAERNSDEVRRLLKINDCDPDDGKPSVCTMVYRFIFLATTVALKKVWSELMPCQAKFALF